VSALQGLIEATSNLGWARIVMQVTINIADNLTGAFISVLRGPLYVIDNQEFTGTFGWLEFQSELLLHRGKNRWFCNACGHGKRPACRVVATGGRSTLAGHIYQMNVKEPRDSGLVDDLAVQVTKEEFDKIVETYPLRFYGHVPSSIGHGKGPTELFFGR